MLRPALRSEVPTDFWVLTAPLVRELTELERSAPQQLPEDVDLLGTFLEGARLTASRHASSISTVAAIAASTVSAYRISPWCARRAARKSSSLFVEQIS